MTTQEYIRIHGELPPREVRISGKWPSVDELAKKVSERLAADDDGDIVGADIPTLSGCIDWTRQAKLPSGKIDWSDTGEPLLVKFSLPFRVSLLAGLAGAISAVFAFYWQVNTHMTVVERHINNQEIHVSAIKAQQKYDSILHRLEELTDGKPK